MVNIPYNSSAARQADTPRRADPDHVDNLASNDAHVKERQMRRGVRARKRKSAASRRATIAVGGSSKDFESLAISGSRPRHLERRRTHRKKSMPIVRRSPRRKSASA